VLIFRSEPARPSPSADKKSCNKPKLKLSAQKIKINKGKEKKQLAITESVLPNLFQSFSKSHPKSLLVRNSIPTHTKKERNNNSSNKTKTKRTKPHMPVRFLHRSF